MNNIANEGGAMIDTSQHGDWENFRNETLNGQKYDFDTDAAAAGMVTEGILEFDYVSTDVAHRLLNLPPIEDYVFDLLEIDLHDVKRVVVNREARMQYAQVHGRAAMPGSTHRSRTSPSTATTRSQDGQSKEISTGRASSTSTAETTETTELAPVVVADASADSEAAADAEPEPASTPLERQSISAVARSISTNDEQDPEGVWHEDEEAKERAAVRIQAAFKGRMVRRLHNAKRHAQPILRQKTDGHTELAKASQRARVVVSDGSNEVAVIEKTIADVVTSTRRKIYHKQRHPWWVVNQHQSVIVSNASARRHLIAKRQLVMLRRATVMFYFSCAQLERVMEAVPEEYHVEVIVTMFSRITDLENLDSAQLLKHDTFDKDGNGCVMWEELQMLRSAESPDVHTRCGFSQLPLSLHF